MPLFSARFGGLFSSRPPTRWTGRRAPRRRHNLWTTSSRCPWAVGTRRVSARDHGPLLPGTSRADRPEATNVLKAAARCSRHQTAYVLGGRLTAPRTASTLPAVRPARCIPRRLRGPVAVSMGRAGWPACSPGRLGRSVDLGAGCCRPRRMAACADSADALPLPTSSCPAERGTWISGPVMFTKDTPWEVGAGLDKALGCGGAATTHGAHANTGSERPATTLEPC
jgi:hypothetical protein